jgi:hypothetical protein
MIKNYKYITSIYFKRAFFIANSKRFLMFFNPYAPFFILKAQEVVAISA